MTSHGTNPPGSSRAPAARPAVPPRRHATSNATRLLCAGAYLDPVYRKAVIRELLTNWWRTVPPAYGYDTVSVLAHALAADDLRRKQVRIVWAGSIAILVVAFSGGFGGYGIYSPLLILWLVWAAAVMRRVATLQILATRLRPAQAAHDQGFDGSYPESPRLTAHRVATIAREQAAPGGRILYGGYTPFVGAGAKMYQWSNAELLIGAPPNPLAQSVLRSGREGVQDEPAPDSAGARPEIKPFTVDELTDYVARRMAADLRDDPPAHERIDALVVERRKYGKVTGEMPAQAQIPAIEPIKVHWNDEYDASREYLCVRVGSWQQELVTSVFVGFDVKGNTLHTEFCTYVLAPIVAGFHLVDRLPVELGGGLIARIGWDALKGGPSALLPGGGAARKRVQAAPDHSEFQFGRYARSVVDRGARASVRELAASGYHHFFQESDADKYTRIVERRLLRIIEDFLVEHDVDLADHRALQTNVLQQNFGDNNNLGSGTLNDNRSRPTPGRESHHD
ncbi:MAG: hypothetical protein ACRDVE_22300 [Actinocrinis sp.]